MNAGLDNKQHRTILQRIARQAMVAKGLVPDFPPDALAELEGIHGPATGTVGLTRDLRSLLWCSIDNDDSRDLDQLTVAEALPNGAAKVLVAIADVDAVVKRHSALDHHARQNTTSVYTVAETFPMLPEKLSTDLTSLNHASDRLAVVIEIVLTGDGTLQSSDIYQAMVRNWAKLAYHSVAVWLEGSGPKPPEIGAVIFRLAGDFRRQLLIHAGSDVDILGYLNRAALFARAACGAAIALELHALNGQRPDAERISKCCRDHFEVVNPLGVRFFMNSI